MKLAIILLRTGLHSCPWPHATPGIACGSVPPNAVSTRPCRLCCIARSTSLTSTRVPVHCSATSWISLQIDMK